MSIEAQYKTHVLWLVGTLRAFTRYLGMAVSLLGWVGLYALWKREELEATK